MIVELYDEETGERWRTLQECADALGISRSQLAYATQRGRRVCGRMIRREYYGTPRKKRYLYDHETKRIYDSVSSAAEAVGLSRSTVGQHVGTYCRWEWKEIE